MSGELRAQRQLLGRDPAPLVPSPATHITEILETVLTGLILAFIFRAFLVEPFIIPTGSMADTLLGGHATRVCPACGWEFDFAPVRSPASARAAFVPPAEVVCPNCQLAIETANAPTAPKAGDRILVHKWPYLLGGVFRPKRWDVIVFRDPADPDQHYIKRLIGLPGESVELLDGDVFINGRIARKPPEVQQALWFVVFDQSYAPERDEPAGRWSRWVTQDAPPEGGGWSGMDTRIIRYDGLDQTSRTLAFVTDGVSDYLRDFYAYDRRSSGTPVGDVRITAEVTFLAGEGQCRWELVRAPSVFAAEVHRDGLVQLTVSDEQSGGRVVRLTAPPRPAFATGRQVTVEFGRLDYRVYLKIDGQEVLTTTEAEYKPDVEALRAATDTDPVTIRLVARDLRLVLEGLRIDRDVYYTCHPGQGQRACAGEPFTLHGGEYFVLGDNSPDSHDSREWQERGPHLPADYRPGTVREDQIVGAAAFVYLPGLLPLDAGARWRVPDLGRVRFVR